MIIVVNISESILFRYNDKVMKMVLMGTGTSHGVPVIACECRVCKSTAKEDKRTRCSAYVEGEDSNLVIDVGPEFRIQALATNIKKLDAVLITHGHADHCHGLDDIRVFSHTRPEKTSSGIDLTNLSEEELQKISPNWKLETEGKGIPIYSNEITIEDLYRKFEYVFHPRALGGGIPKLNLQVCDSFSVNNQLEIGSINAFPVNMKHGNLPTVGWVLHEKNSLHAIAYLTDCSFIPDESIDELRNSGLIFDHLIIDSLRENKHPTHCCFSESLSYAERICAEHTWFTHITHEKTHSEIQEYINIHLSEYKNLSRIVSEGGSVAPAYDGLVINTFSD